MNICIVSQEFPAETGFGGIATYAYTISRALARLGHRVFVIAGTAGREEKNYEVDGVDVLRIPLSSPVVLTKRTAIQLISYSKKVAAAVMRLNDSVGLDVVEFPELAAEGHALICSGRSPVPAVVRIHTPLYLVFKNDARKWDAQSRAMSDLENEVIRKAPLVSSPSRSLARIVAKDLGLDRGNIRVLANPVDCDRFAPDGEPKGMTVLRVARLQRFKGTHVLVRAVPKILAKFPDTKFVFAGRDTLSGPGGTSYREWMMKSLPEKYLGSLEFLDNVDAADVPALYRRATVAVVPSLYENCPYVCLEAMAAGRPLVASRVGGIPEIVEDGEGGLLVPPRNPDALADAVCALLADRKARSRMGEKARESMLARFDSSVVAGEMIGIYEEAKMMQQAAPASL